MRDHTGTLRERMIRLETIMENHLHYHETRDKQMMRVLSGLTVGVILLAVPVLVRWLGGVV